MEKNPSADFHLIDPRSLWSLWKVLQDFSKTSIPRNPPSSGFIGIAMLLPVCSYLDVVEYIPSTRLNGKCHYYSDEVNLSLNRSDQMCNWRHDRSETEQRIKLSFLAFRWTRGARSALGIHWRPKNCLQSAWTRQMISRFISQASWEFAPTGSFAKIASDALLYQEIYRRLLDLLFAVEVGDDFRLTLAFFISIKRWVFQIGFRRK